MTYLYGFTKHQLQEILKACQQELLDGSVTQINSLGTSAAFTKMPVERRIELVTATLQKFYPETYGQRVKTGRVSFWC